MKRIMAKLFNGLFSAFYYWFIGFIIGGIFGLLLSIIYISMIWLYLIPMSILTTMPLNYYLLKSIKMHLKWWCFKAMIAFIAIFILNLWIEFTRHPFSAFVNIGGSILFVSLLVDIIYIKRPKKKL
jgi:hypothetical protein